jgi:hypothetical protein
MMSRFFNRNNHADDRSLQGRAADSSTGSAVSNVLPVLVGDGKPPAHRGRRGAAPPRVTACAAEPAAPSGSGLGNPSGSLTATGTQRQRMKWTRDLNLSLMRAYFISTKVEEECEGYRQRLHAEWRDIYPDSTLDEQRVCSQLNSIIRRKVFSTAELDVLKREVRQELAAQNPQQEEEEEQSDSGPDEPAEADGTEEAQADTQQSNADTVQKLKNAYETVKLCYQGMPLGIRPRIPKVQCNTKVYEMVYAMDQVLASEVGNADNLAELVGLVHCAALATCQVLGCKVRTRDETIATQQKSKE